MSKTLELARHLETLHINDMYKTDFYWTWDKTDDEIDAIFTVADALRDLRERNKSTRIFDSGLGISLFRDNSTRTRFSFASACNLLGLEEQVLDEKKSQIAHGETVRETANMVSFMADVIGIRDDMYIGEGHKYQKTFMDALEEGYRDGILEQRPTLVNLQCDVDHAGYRTEIGRTDHIRETLRQAGFRFLEEDGSRIEAGAIFYYLRWQADVSHADRGRVYHKAVDRRRPEGYMEGGARE